jgi:hypothetical protein
MVCPPKGFKVDLDNQPLTMTTRLLPPADAFAHKSAHYPQGRRRSPLGELPVEVVEALRLVVESRAHVGEGPGSFEQRVDWAGHGDFSYGWLMRAI